MRYPSSKTTNLALNIFALATFAQEFTDELKAMNADKKASHLTQTATHFLAKAAEKLLENLPLDNLLTVKKRSKQAKITIYYPPQKPPADYQNILTNDVYTMGEMLVHVCCKNCPYNNDDKRHEKCNLYEVFVRNNMPGWTDTDDPRYERKYKKCRYYPDGLELKRD